MSAPIFYVSKFVTDPDKAFAALRYELSWERRGDAPRCEYYCNDIPKPYVYGRGRGERLYEPRPYHPVIMDIRRALEALTGTTFEVCFLNRYLGARDHLGWHADDSPEMDDARPIGVVSLGFEREIWFREKAKPCNVCGAEPPFWHKMSCYQHNRDVKDLKDSTVFKQLLNHGSLCLMAPGMQDAWEHRIPKAPMECGERISLTFRGYVNLEKPLEAPEGCG